MLALGTIGTCGPAICVRPSRLGEQNQSAALKDFPRCRQAALYTLARLSPLKTALGDHAPGELEPNTRIRRWQNGAAYSLTAPLAV